MAYIKATYNVDEETVTVNGTTFEHGKYWKTQDGVTDEQGVWDDVNEIYVPHGEYDKNSGWLWPTHLDFNNYGNN